MRVKFQENYNTHKHISHIALPSQIHTIAAKREAATMVLPTSPRVSLVFPILHLSLSLSCKCGCVGGHRRQRQKFGAARLVWHRVGCFIICCYTSENTLTSCSFFVFISAYVCHTLNGLATAAPVYLR